MTLMRLTLVALMWTMTATCASAAPKPPKTVAEAVASLKAADEAAPKPSPSPSPSAPPGPAVGDLLQVVAEVTEQSQPCEAPEEVAKAVRLQSGQVASILEKQTRCRALGRADQWVPGTDRIVVLRIGGFRSTPVWIHQPNGK